MARVALGPPGAGSPGPGWRWRLPGQPGSAGTERGRGVRGDGCSPSSRRQGLEVGRYLGRERGKRGKISRGEQAITCSLMLCFDCLDRKIKPTKTHLFEGY